MNALPAVLDRPVRSDAASTAVVDGDREVSYGELSATVGRWAGALAARGVTAGDRVAVVVARSEPALACSFAAARLGAVVVPVGERLRRAQVGHILRDSGAVVALAVGESGDEARRAAACPVVDAAELADADAGPAPIAATGPEDLAALLYTSGSTGLAKGVMLSHRNLAAGAEAVATYLRLTPRDRVLSVLPWSFDYGLNQVLSTFWAGGTVVIGRSTFGPDICRQLLRDRITGLAGVPPLWEALVGRPSPLAARPLPHLRFATSSGGALTPRVGRAIRAAQPHVDLYAMYGLTEAFRSTYLPPELYDAHPTSIGRPIPGAEVLVLDREGRECDVDEVGELVHRGPTVALGYWGDREATARVFRPDPRPGSSGTVVHSGDLVRRRADGLLEYVGRAVELIKVQGVRVSPTEVETLLLDIGVARHAVVVPEEGPGGTQLVAVVVPADPTTTADEVLARCRPELPVHLLPARAVLCDDLPRSPTGKLDRTAIARAHAVRRPELAEVAP